MKRIISISFIALVVSGSIFADKPAFEITPLVGYLLGGSQNYSEGNVNMSNAFTYGLALSIVDDVRGISGDFTWTRADGQLDFTAVDVAYTDDSFGMSTNYFLVGANKDFGKNKFRFFIGGDIGAAWFDSRVSHVEDAWFFAFDLKTGVKFYLSDRIGLRFQGRFLVPMSFSDGGFWLGIGSGGSSAGISFGGNAAILQGDFLLGLIIRI